MLRCTWQRCRRAAQPPSAVWRDGQTRRLAVEQHACCACRHEPEQHQPLDKQVHGRHLGLVRSGEQKQACCSRLSLHLERCFAMRRVTHRSTGASSISTLTIWSSITSLAKRRDNKTTKSDQARGRRRHLSQLKGNTRGLCAEDGRAPPYKYSSRCRTPGMLRVRPSSTQPPRPDLL